MAHFLIEFNWVLLNLKSSLYILDIILYQTCLLKYFILVSDLCSNSVDNVFSRVFTFNKVEFINYFFHRSCFWCHHHHTHGHLGLSCYLLGFYSFALYIYVNDTFLVNFYEGLYLDSLFFTWMSSSFSTMCWRDYFSSLVLTLPLCWKSHNCIYVSLFLGSQFCSVVLVPSLLSPPFSLSPTLPFPPPPFQMWHCLLFDFFIVNLELGSH